MLNGEKYSFASKFNRFGEVSYAPYLPIILSYRNQSIEMMGLLDTGASMNVLPYEIGLQLGAVWDEQTFVISLSGNLANIEARALLLSGTVSRFAPVNLAFAWTRQRNMPIILGRLNFLAEFDVCFYVSELGFEIAPKQSH
ncbi:MULTISPECIES: retroviral-like aspartic protease [unclassified Microcoleus]|uniref:retroviral-like aspartic protease n=1 Tax=unclassified Microcoleus TaxID=2642155 RepID=UPI001D54197F|nr:MULTISPECIES: retroviral-like aspartic protease [unclassified Microcoleus]TAF88359.1 MAG: retroviral-like aspartic protease [Oscillatoriales cyanobacterium]MCC3412378.1 retroviral-like aspartic protease [Microcoleus sp. PH2017_02_FOX_O_A]MCC3423590.1 retroviral-like aspartic protease [Microcoleus sp. PH2017_01_SCD_O_A]MCC3449025.1 retroviral-like aspartic protease [Microcoleus sp. PH2017_09_SFU_O_A]MCC3565124.1 retroviral-like aspartic protease [Microcoleus sp. PH2017_31_RDM_U_A]